MSEIDLGKLDRIKSDLSEDDKGLWISFLVPNEELTERAMSEVEEDNAPNIMFHNWFYVSVNVDNFESDGIFYTEDEPYRMEYNGDSYDLSDVQSIDHNVHYQDSEILENGLSDNFTAWLKKTCSELGVNYGDLESRLKSTVLPDVKEQDDELVIIATIYEQQLPP
jgi:hypothetical protein